MGADRNLSLTKARERSGHASHMNAPVNSRMTPASLPARRSFALLGMTTVLVPRAGADLGPARRPQVDPSTRSASQPPRHRGTSQQPADHLFN